MGKAILFTASTFSHIRNFHLPYLKAFHDLGWEVHVACGGTSEPVPYADRIIKLPFQKKLQAPENFRAAAILRKRVRQGKYTLISTHTTLAAFFTRLAVKGLVARPLVINTVHGYLFDDETPAPLRNLLLAAECLVTPQTDLLLTMNQWDHVLANQYRLGKRVAFVPGMGVDVNGLVQPDVAAKQNLRRKMGIPDRAFVAIYPAEFSKRKSQEVLVRAAAQLPEEMVLILPGQGALQRTCQQLAIQLGVERRVLFPGHVEDMKQWYAMADVSVSASRSEGLPFHVMEAMCVGLPVVASRVKGHTDLIERGVTGLLYPYGDVDACANALRAMLDNPELRLRMADNARANIEQYTLEQVLPVHMEQYRTLVPELRETELQVL